MKEYMKTIKLNLGKKVLIDAEDYKALSKYSWYTKIKSNGDFVAGRTIRMPNNAPSITIYMHRVIMNAPDGAIVDHKNGDTLDNRKSNLRFCSKAENAQNSRRYKSNTSGYKGVGRLNNGTWYARIKANKKRYNLGTYQNKEEAALAYNKGAIKYHGEFAKLNIIPKTL